MNHSKSNTLFIQLFLVNVIIKSFLFKILN